MIVKAPRPWDVARALSLDMTKTPASSCEIPTIIMLTFIVEEQHNLLGFTRIGLPKAHYGHI